MAGFTESQGYAADAFLTFLREGYDVFHATYTGLADDGKLSGAERRKIYREAIEMALMLAMDIESAVEAKVKGMDVATMFITVHDIVQDARDKDDADVLFPTTGLT